MDDNLVSIKRNKVVVSSRQVAENFHKRHDNVVRDIDNLLGDVLKNEEMFFKTTAPDSYGREQKMYYMNRDGFSLLVMGFNGKKALNWKLQYIKAFNWMEKLLTERNTAAWIESRKTGILARKGETSMIQKLIEYAKGQGSKNADMLYMTYSRLANKMAGIQPKCRNNASVKQLNRLEEIETIILNVIRLGMAADKYYKEIYQDCKSRLNSYLEVTFQNIERIGA